MTKAKSVEDVVLGEAKAGDYQDMVAIVSVIENRANKLGLTYEQVVQNQNEFNAYNKALPPGVNKYRDLVRQAIQEVKVNGPVHNATFYATSSKKSGLPNGLAYVAETAGHQFFEDPKNRAIGTSVGYVTPSRGPVNIAGQPPNTLYDVSTQPSVTTATRGTALSPVDPKTALEDRPMSRVIDVAEYNQYAGRSQMPTSGVTQDVQAAVTKNFGPEYSVGVYSGMEPSGTRAVGSKLNHPGGYALDFDVVDPNGKALDMSDPVHAAALREVQKDLAAKGHAIGYGAGYMEPGRTHVGSPPGSPVVGWGRDKTKATMDPGLYAELANAKATGVNLPSIGPMPSFRSAPTAAQSTVSRAPIGPVNMSPSIEQHINAMTPAISMPTAMPAMPAIAPTPSSVPIPTPRPTIAPVQPAPVPPTPAPAQAPPQVSTSRPVPMDAPPSMPSFTGQDVWSGRAQSGIATNGNQITRNPDGTVSMTSARYGYTETMNPDGSYRSTTAPGIFGLDAAARRAFGGISGPLGLPGINQVPSPQTTQTKPTNTGFRTSDRLKGASVGLALGGPIGAVLGAFVGPKVMDWGNARFGKSKFTDSFGNLMPTPAQAQRTFQQRFTPGLGFPDAPAGGNQQGGRSSFGDAAARGEFGAQAQAAANSPGRGLY